MSISKINLLFLSMVFLPLAILARQELQDTNTTARVRAHFDELYASLPSQYMIYGVLEETIDELYGKPAYATFADSVTNDWQTILANIGQIATNDVERLLIMGVGLHYDEDFYLDFLSALCDMRTNGVITAAELINGSASHRYDIDSCLVRRYQEPKVVELVNKLKLAAPQSAKRWDDILSGAAYTNYLEEVKAGLWQ